MNLQLPVAIPEIPVSKIDAAVAYYRDNLGSRDEVDELHRGWSATGAKIAAPPESKPWNLHEFTATDLDGNLLRVFHDFAWEASSAPAEAT
jgi:hypothetical protein